MPRSRQLSIYLVVVGVMLGACGGDGDGDPDTQPSTTAPPTTESRETEDEAALRQLAEDWYLAIRAIYYEDADLDTASEFIDGPYLASFEDEVEAFRTSGTDVRPGDRSRMDIESIEVSGESAEVVECVINADEVLAEDGSVADDSVVARRFLTTAARSDEGWRFVNRTELDEVEGADECPA